MEWQFRPLDSIYPIVFLDGIVFKIRKDSRVINKCVYSVLGIDMEGKKDILGIWISENERASFWASVCNDLKNRGVTDILIACRDNLSQNRTAALYHSSNQKFYKVCLLQGFKVADG